MNKTRFEKQFAELPYREVNRKNLDRVGDMVLQCMGEAGSTPLPEKWHSIIEQIDRAYSESPEHLVVVLWRLMCGFSVTEERNVTELKKLKPISKVPQ